MPKYPLPDGLKNKCSQEDYTHWLHDKASAHVRRDKKRGNTVATTKLYRQAIHEAVCNGSDKDAYTGQPLRWDLIRKYNNKEAQKGKREYKKIFAEMPTVDHVDNGMGEPDFRICSWRTNDSKNDLTIDELIEFCEVFLDFQKNGEKSELDRLAVRLFMKFTRIEYALKAAGFHFGEGKEAKPNWNLFASYVSGVLENDPEISAAVRYMIKKPPKKQMIRNNLLEWEEPPHEANKTHEILLCVRRVRNNLFHGGKFNGHWFAPVRSKELLLHSLSILDACLRASPVLKEAFESE